MLELLGNLCAEHPWKIPMSRCWWINESSGRGIILRWMLIHKCLRTSEDWGLLTVMLELKISLQVSMPERNNNHMRSGKVKWRVSLIFRPAHHPKRDNRLPRLLQSVIGAWHPSNSSPHCTLPRMASNLQTLSNVWSNMGWTQLEHSSKQLRCACCWANSRVRSFSSSFLPQLYPASWGSG